MHEDQLLHERRHINSDIEPFKKQTENPIAIAHLLGESQKEANIFILYCITQTQHPDLNMVVSN